MARLTAFVLTLLAASCVAQVNSDRFSSQSVKNQRKEYSQTSLYNSQPGYKQSTFIRKNNAGFEKPLANKGAFAHSVFNQHEVRQPAFNKPEFSQAEIKQNAFSKSEYEKSQFTQSSSKPFLSNEAEYKKSEFTQSSGVRPFVSSDSEFKKSEFAAQSGVKPYVLSDSEYKKSEFTQSSGVKPFVSSDSEFKKSEFAAQSGVKPFVSSDSEYKKSEFAQSSGVKPFVSSDSEYKKSEFTQSFGVKPFVSSDSEYKKSEFAQSSGVKPYVLSDSEYKKSEFNKPAFSQSSYSQSIKSEFVTPVPILKYANEVMPDGTFQYGYESGDGTAEEVRGYMRTLDVPESEPAQVIEGQYSYVGPDGERYTVTYVADENGFRAKGAHLPVPPPIPVEIQRSLELIKRLQAEQQPDIALTPVKESDLITYRRPVQIRARSLEDAEDQVDVTTVYPVA